MRDIPISEANILWNSGLNGGTPSFAIRPQGDRDYDDYSFSLGACLKSWRESSTEEQKAKLMIELWHITCYHGVPAEMMKDELLQIPEYRDMLADDCLPARFQHERN